MSKKSTELSYSLSIFDQNLLLHQDLEGYINVWASPNTYGDEDSGDFICFEGFESEAIQELDEIIKQLEQLKNKLLN